MRFPALRRGAWLLASAGLAAALAPLPARAQVQLPGAPPAPEEERDPNAGTRRRPPPDTRIGNLLISPRVALTLPAGSVATDTPAAGLVGVGLNVGGVLGIGVSRYSVLEVSGGYTLFNGQDCDGCKGRVFDVGLGLSYHMAQGIAVDPWMSFGMGYRQSMFTVNDPTPGTNHAPLPAPIDQTYRGFDFARIALGADFYPAPVFGLGPFFGVDLGTNLGLPSPIRANQEINPSVYAYFQIGLRIALDPFRRSLVSSSRAAAKR